MTEPTHSGLSPGWRRGAAGSVPSPGGCGSSGRDRVDRDEGDAAGKPWRDHIAGRRLAAPRDARERTRTGGVSGSARRAGTLHVLGLDPAYGAYLDVLPGVTLATVNLMSLLGLHRRLRGAIVGHLAAFEMTSSVPNRRYATGLRRLGLGDPQATAFFDEHVTADAVHENVAAVDLAGGLVRLEPALLTDVLFGARCLIELEGRWAAHLLAAWGAGRSSLATPALLVESAA